MKTEIFNIVIELDPLSYNSEYITKFRRGAGGRPSQWTYLNPVFAEYKKKIQEQLATHLVKNKIQLPEIVGSGQYLWLNLEYFIDVFFKNSNPKNKDNSNFIKPIEDAIKDTVGIDDSYNFYVTSLKLDKSKHEVTNTIIFASLCSMPYDDFVIHSEYLTLRNSNV